MTNTKFFFYEVYILKVNASFTPIASPVIQPIEPLTVLRGQPTRVMCTVILGNLPIHFRWLKDGEAIPHGVGIEFVNGAFSSSVVIADATTVHDGRYTCEASNLAAAVNYTTALTVKGGPNFQYLKIEGKGAFSISHIITNSYRLHKSKRGISANILVW